MPWLDRRDGNACTPPRLLHLEGVRLRRWCLSALVTIGVASFQTPARAQSPAEQMLAQSLFDEGRALMAAKRYAEACPKLAESQRLDPGGGTLLNVAICHELEGRLGTASMEMNAALAQARKDGRQDRFDIATTHLAAIGDRVPKLTIRVPHEEEGLEVFLDGTALRRPAWNVATIVDPGSHVIDARAPNASAPFRMTVDVHEREQRVVDVVLPAAETPPPLPASTPANDATAFAPIERPSEPRLRTNPAHTAALVVGSGGLVVAGVAGLGWAISKAQRGSECEEERSFCTPDGLSAADRERAFGWTSLIGAAVGIGGLVTAQIVPKYISATATPTHGGAAISLSATFF
jgi:hypothetical protein